MKSDTEINVYQASLTESDLRKLRRKLSKRANQRLVRLERAKSKITGESYAEFGAADISYEYLNHQQSGKKRFTENVNVNMDYNELRREVSVLQNFLNAKSSTVKGMRDIEKQRVKTFESGEWGNPYTDRKKRKLKFASTKEFYDFFHSDVFAELKDAGYTSEQIVESYDTFRERYKGSDEEAIAELEKLLEKYREKNKIQLKDLLKSVEGKKKLT